jgi:ribosome-associated protein
MSKNIPEKPKRGAKKAAPEPVEEQEIISKTQLKQAAERLKKIGLELVDLTKGEREKIPLDDDLLTAVELCTKINRKKDGFRRQLQLIGKKLRDRDIEPIELALARLKSSHSEANRHFHGLERLRDDIINKGDDAINAAITEYPQLERQKLRQMQRTAQKQADENKPPAAAREIFQYLRGEIPHG